MSERLPIRLGDSPLLEAIVEIRFQPTMEAVGDVLPGQLFGKFRKDYPKVVPLPMASVPREIRTQNPDFKHVSSHSLRGDGKTIQVGDRVLALSALVYPGWTKLKSSALEVLEFAASTQLLGRIERFSFKYINVLPTAGVSLCMSLLNVSLDLAGQIPIERGLSIRFEQDRDSFTTVIQINPGVSATEAKTNRKIEGLLLDIDTLYQGGPINLADLDASLLDRGHQIAKVTFFSLLTNETLDSMKPEW